MSSLTSHRAKERGALGLLLSGGSDMPAKLAGSSNRQGWMLERLALRAGATHMSVWSDEAIQETLKPGLKPRFQLNCCSVPFREEFALLKEE